LYFGSKKKADMKKILFIVIICCCVTWNVFGADIYYPSIINNGTVLANTGIGWGEPINDGFSLQCPPLTLSFDYALPIATLPFTLGAILGFSSEKWQGPSIQNFGIAGRIAYHISLPIEDANIYRRLDTYILITMGGILETASQKNKGVFWGGFGGGLRYFFQPDVGAYIELGGNTMNVFSGGISFKI
jgi:hypothetical protein